MNQATRGRIATAIVLTAALAFGAVGCSGKKDATLQGEVKGKAPMTDSMTENCKSAVRQQARESLSDTSVWDTIHQRAIDSAIEKGSKRCETDIPFRAAKATEYKKLMEAESRSKPPEGFHRVKGLVSEI